MNIVYVKRHENNIKQAGAELCQVQFKLGLGKIVFADVNIVFDFVFPLLKV